MCTQTDELFEQFKKTRSLLIVLTVTYFLNQFGYMFNGTVYEVKLQNIGFLTINSTYGEFLMYVIVLNIMVVANIISNVLEIASRALTFYPYILFSKPFRKSFMAIISGKID